MKKKNKEQLFNLVSEFAYTDSGKLTAKLKPEHHVLGLVQWLLEENRIILNNNQQDKETKCLKQKQSP